MGMVLDGISTAALYTCWPTPSQTLILFAALPTSHGRVLEISLRRAGKLHPAALWLQRCRPVTLQILAWLDRFARNLGRAHATRIARGDRPAESPQHAHFNGFAFGGCLNINDVCRSIPEQNLLGVGKGVAPPVSGIKVPGRSETIPPSRHLSQSSLPVRALSHGHAP